MTARDIILQLCQHFEGLRLTAYLCPAGIPTIGYGATGRDIRLGMVVTQEWAVARLYRDIDAALAAAFMLCPGLHFATDARQAAVGDFVFNLGAGRLAASTLRKRINISDWDTAAIELNRWVWGGGRKLPGLIARRQVEGLMLRGQLNSLSVRAQAPLKLTA